jgi:MarR family transcriptional regulator, organic hydroperoxide resistance regulator
MDMRTRLKVDCLVRGVADMRDGPDSAGDRLDLERLIGADLRELTSQSDWIARTFADQNNVSANEFRALLFVLIAETGGVRMTAGDLRKQMGLSGAAITYLVERMAEVGHLRRETDPTDRRKVILRYGEHGMDVARTFFQRLAQHNHVAMADLPDSDLEAAHRTFTAVVGAMKDFRAELVSPANSRPHT